MFEEEDSVDENDDGAKDGLVASVREERALKKDEIKSLRTQVLTIREKLADKTAKIEVIKDTLKQSAGVTDFERVLEAVDLDERDDFLDDDDEDDDYYQEMEPDQFQVQQTDPQILKLQDKVRLLRHRCSASIGNSIFDQAIEYLTQSSHASATDKRQQLV